MFRYLLIIKYFVNLQQYHFFSVSYARLSPVIFYPSVDTVDTYFSDRFVRVVFFSYYVLALKIKHIKTPTNQFLNQYLFTCVLT